MSKKRLQLKGNNAKRLRPKQKKKMESTLARMQETRENDSKNLRLVIEAKLKWAIAEKEKGINAIKNVQNQVIRLQGAITVLKELLNPIENKEEKE